MSSNCCRERRGTGVIVSTVGGTVFEFGKHLVLFGPSHQAALEGYIPYGPTAAIKREASRIKALASAGFLLANATGDQVIAKRAGSLSPKAGAGAVEYLTGKTGASIAAAIISGSLPADEVITAARVASGVDLAKKALAKKYPSNFSG